MGKRPHIVAVNLPDVAEAALEGGLGAVVAAAGATTDVQITFGDNSTYLYPSVSTPIAFALQADPERVFPTIRYWPGYHRLR
jgi:hypothetical protein